MNKKTKQAIVAITLFVMALIFILVLYQRRYKDVMLEMIIYPPAVAWGNHFKVYHFIVLNNGRFISYSGIRADSNNAMYRFDVLMWPLIRRRSRITLNDEDFQNILELATLLSENRANPLMISSSWQYKLLLGEYAYHSGLELYQIADELMRLSPLTDHHPLITPEFLEILENLS